MTGQKFQKRVGEWLLKCFGRAVAWNTRERNHRFLEESLELVQSLGCTQAEAHDLVDYVFSRAVGEPYQEIGGVCVTLAALCEANSFDQELCAESELKRIWVAIEKIRAKQASKPRFGPRP